MFMNHDSVTPSILFTLRTDSVGSHQNQVSFPGGMHEKGDRNLVETALRECEEETGISASTVDVWGIFRSLPTNNKNVIVYPVLGFVHGQNGEEFLNPTTLKYSTGEVQEVFSMSFDKMCSPENVHLTQFKSKHGGYSVPVFIGAKHRIWGLTALILHLALLDIVPEKYTFHITHNQLINRLKVD